MNAILQIALNVFVEVLKSVFGELIQKAFSVIEKAQVIGDCVKLNADIHTPNEISDIVKSTYDENICINDWINDRGNAKFDFVLNECREIFEDKNLKTNVLSLIIEVLVAKFKNK